VNLRFRPRGAGAAAGSGATTPIEETVTRRVKMFDLSKLSQTLGSLASLIILSLVLWQLSGVFMTSGNWINIARQASFNAILGMGMTFVILTAGIDLSVGSIVAVSSVVGGLLMYEHSWNMWPAVLMMVVTGAAFGLFNGLIVTIGKIPPFIVTLGTMQIFRGIALQLTNGKPMYGIKKKQPKVDIWGTRDWHGIPSPVIITVVVFLILFLILRYTRLGLYTYAIGGTSLFGGEGTIVGTIIGALLMAVIRNGLTLLHISAFYQQIVIGAVIIVAVLIDQLRRRG
jgi:ribose/xylose/arabinose/galactoside ABC-type transport system permease subunit